MAHRIFEAALENRLMTLILIVVFVAIGLRAMVLLPIDASPDVTPNVVQIVTDAPGLGAAEIEIARQNTSKIGDFYRTMFSGERHTNQTGWRSEVDLKRRASSGCAAIAISWAF